MNPEILKNYENELAFLRQLGEQFAVANPKLAGQLSSASQDPHVMRFIEGISLLTTHVHTKLDKDFFKTNETLLNILYPNYLAPIPAMGIVQLESKIEQFILRGTPLVSDKNYGPSCQFTTGFSAQLLPLQTEKVRWLKDASHSLITGLELHLVCQQPEMKSPNNLRFYLNAPLQQSFALYELLFNHTLSISIKYADNRQAISINKKNLKQVGFSKKEYLLPYEARTLTGRHLLTEFFAFPEKFLFFDLIDLPETILNKNIIITFYLEKSDLITEINIKPNYFQLNCVPVINLFKSFAEPFYLTQRKSEYLLIPDVSNPSECADVYRVENVSIVDENNSVICRSLFGLKYGEQENDFSYYYLTEQDGDAFLHLDIKDDYVDGVVSAEILCTNRNLPAQLPFGGHEPSLSFVDENYKQTIQIKCLMPFMPSRHLFDQQKNIPALISQLAVGCQDFSNAKHGVDNLRTILSRYNFSNTHAHQNLLRGILELTTRPITRPDYTGLLQGTEIILEVDEDYFTDTSLYIFGNILAHYFVSSCALNTFTEFVIKGKHAQIIACW